MNYAKSQPDMAIMAVNTFVKVITLYFSLVVTMLIALIDDLLYRQI